MVAPKLEMKYKHHFSVVLNRLFNTIQQMDMSPQQADSFTLLSELVIQIKQGLENISAHDSVIGAIQLAETAFTVAI